MQREMLEEIFCWIQICLNIIKIHQCLKLAMPHEYDVITGLILMACCLIGRDK